MLFISDLYGVREARGLWWGHFTESILRSIFVGQCNKNHRHRTLVIFQVTSLRLTI